MRISDWSSDVCSSDLQAWKQAGDILQRGKHAGPPPEAARRPLLSPAGKACLPSAAPGRSDLDGILGFEGEENLSLKASFEAPGNRRLPCQAHAPAGWDGPQGGTSGNLIAFAAQQDRKSTRLNSVTNATLVCRHLLETKNIKRTKK